MLENYSFVLFFALFSIIFIVIAMFLVKLVSPHHPNPLKYSTYECGEPPVGSGWLNYNMRFYMIGLIFLIFDVEIAFVYPVATIFRDWVAAGIGGLAVVEILIFVGILFLGLIYVWVKGDLEWVREFVRGGERPHETMDSFIPPEKQGLE
jgi:NADH-quinone oxidoreductase subunit A